MNKDRLIKDVLSELTFRCKEGIVDLDNDVHRSIISEILHEWGYPELITPLFRNLSERGKTPEDEAPVADATDFKNPALKKAISYRNSKGENVKGFVGNLLRMNKDSDGYKKAIRTLGGEDSDKFKQAMDDLGAQNAPKETPDNNQQTGEEGETEEPVGNIRGSEMFKHAVDIKNKKKKSPHEELQNELTTFQKNIESQRDLGMNGKGTAASSQGESRYCSAMNNLKVEKFNLENEKEIQKNITKFKSKRITANEKRDLNALGYFTPYPDVAYEYISSREVYADKELERIKSNKNSVFYKKDGFSESDKSYKEWMYSAYDGAIATQKILFENTNISTSDPHITVQSDGIIDNRVQSMINERLEKSKDVNNQDDIDYYNKELDDFGKYKKYHDTFVIGTDKKNRFHFVSISNKKGSNLKDPQANTTPAHRFGVIKEHYMKLDESYDLAVVTTITRALDTGITTVINTKQASIIRTNIIDIDDSIAEICETPQMKKYIKNLDGHKKFNKFIEGKGIKYDMLSMKDKLTYMQQFSQLLIDSGKKPAFNPFGKIMTKIGEFSQIGTFRELYPYIDFETYQIGICIDIKQTEKNAINKSHEIVVKTIKHADERIGYPKNNINGPHVQAYISTVMEAMHFDSYIDGGDGKLILQMGIRGVLPVDIRECLATETGFIGEIDTNDGRNDLKKHIREKLSIDSSAGVLVIVNELGKKSIIEDTWRTAGTSQKVASSLGKDLRIAIARKVDERRRRK